MYLINPINYEMMQIAVDLERIEISVSDPALLSQDDDEALKEWVWENCKTEILANMTLNRYVSEKGTEELQLKRYHTYGLAKRLDLLDKIARVQRQFLQSKKHNAVFGGLLEGLLELMDSEYGFIGEAKYEEDGTMYLQTHAATDISWDDATRKFYEENVDQGLKFYNMKSLFGTVMTTKQPLISNCCKDDPRAAGIPEGHPPLNQFLGIPFFKKGGELNGMVGIANKPGGYREDDLEFLEPFTITCNNLIQAYWQIQKNQDLIDTLEDKVVERTRELDLANKELEEANRKVLRASAAQLQHFACMSHEIRTPLNCIIGLSSLLQDTELSPMQDESLKMIVSSSDLLLTVVNDVLDYSKLESGNVEIEVRRNSLQDALDGLVHSIELKGQSKNLVLDTFYDPLLPEYFHTDSRRLQQILYNLLGNAIKFSKEGGTVEFTVSICSAADVGQDPPSYEELNEETSSIEETPRMVPNPHTGEMMDARNIPSGCPFHRSSAGSMSVTADEEKKDDAQISRSHAVVAERSGDASECPFKQSSTGSTSEPANSAASKCPFQRLTLSPAVSESGPKVLRFVVKDYGAGIKEQDLERIFQPFHQASASTERIYGGTGLGLAITSKLVNGLGGTISVDSEEGKWAKFTVDFPFVESVTDVHHTSQRLKNATIVMVGAEPSGIKQFDEVCRRYQVDIVHFENMGEMGSYGKFDNGRDYICLVHEDLYQSGPYERLASTTAKSVLLTFGPKFSVKESKGHYRSLQKMIPCVLMQSMSTYLESSVMTSPTVVTDTPSSHAAPKSYANLKVLIAEDNLINQKVLVRMLKKLGMTKVDVVDNGQKAVDREASEEYDVVLMDMQMPVMDGVDACRLIVARRGSLSVPKVVFVTAHVEDSFKLLSAQAGGSGFLSKPFNVKGIEKCLQNLDL